MPTAAASQVPTVRNSATALARLAKRAAEATALWQEVLLLATVVILTIMAAVLVMMALGRWRRPRHEVATTTPMSVYMTARQSEERKVHFYKGCKALTNVYALEDKKVCLLCARRHKESVGAVLEDARRTA